MSKKDQTREVLRRTRESSCQSESLRYIVVTKVREMLGAQAFDLVQHQPGHSLVIALTSRKDTVILFASERQFIRYSLGSGSTVLGKPKSGLHQARRDQNYLRSVQYTIRSILLEPGCDSRYSSIELISS